MHGFINHTSYYWSHPRKCLLWIGFISRLFFTVWSGAMTGMRSGRSLSKGLFYGLMENILRSFHFLVYSTHDPIDYVYVILTGMWRTWADPEAKQDIPSGGFTGGRRAMSTEGLREAVAHCWKVSSLVCLSPPIPILASSPQFNG